MSGDGGGQKPPVVPVGPSGQVKSEATGVVKGLVVPGLPHPLLCPERNEGWMRIRSTLARGGGPSSLPKSS